MSGFFSELFLYPMSHSAKASQSVLVEKVNTIFLCDDDISDLMSQKQRHHEQI